MVLIALVNVYNQGLTPPVCLVKMSERNIQNSLVMGLSGIKKRCGSSCSPKTELSFRR